LALPVLRAPTHAVVMVPAILWTIATAMVRLPKKELRSSGVVLTARS